MEKKIDILQKRLRYQSQHRGMKEMDLIFHRIALHVLPNMTYEELVKFEEILAFPDKELYGWFFERNPIPENLNPLMNILLNFIKNP